MGTRPPPTQKGNPHGLTLRQHVYPGASIARFADNGGVDLFDIRRKVCRTASPDDLTFCARRSWAHGPESTWMKKIEDAFQDLAERVLRRPSTSLDAAASEVIGEFYALWRARVERRHLPMQVVPPAQGLIGTRVSYTADELELLEKNDIVPMRGDGSIDMRHLIGPIIRMDMDQIRKVIADRRWNVCQADDGEFCVPDLPVHGIIPLTPTLALHSTRSGALSSEALAEINFAMASNAREYIFARDLKVCPGL